MLRRTHIRGPVYTVYASTPPNDVEDTPVKTTDKLLLHSIDAATPPISRTSRAMHLFVVLCVYFAWFVAGVVFAFLINGVMPCAGN